MQAPNSCIRAPAAEARRDRGHLPALVLWLNSSNDPPSDPILHPERTSVRLQPNNQQNEMKRMKRTRDVTKSQLRLEEEQAWSGFLSAAPLFAGEKIACWHQGPEPPDVLCTTVSGRVVGIELTVWVDQEQIQSGKIRERFETAYLSNVASERESRPANIGWIWLYDKHHSINLHYS